jgi:predicted hotdog family 3-hydroxylacyl-ACP dehydratase
MTPLTPAAAHFEGHFPGRPILPGVALLAIVLDALARPAGLRAIPFARLRRPVVPGDVLELDARDGAGGGARFDLRRGGAVVANGELAFGRPDPGAGVAPRPAPMTAPAPPVESLLPQQPPMRFVTSIAGETPDGLLCAARIPAGCALVADGTAPALAALEAAAQAAAAWEALRRWRTASAAAPRMGYLVAVREIELFAARIPADEPFIAAARLAATAPPLMHYAVEAAAGDRPILRGTVATVLVDELAR